MINSDSLIAVVVLYKCKFEDSLSVSSLAKSVVAANCKGLDLVVYDNSPEFNSATAISNSAFLIHYIPDYDNSGVSKAYNMAARLGKEKGKEYLLLMDQDTAFPISFCKDVFSTKKEARLYFPRLIDNDVVISPCKYLLGRGSSLRYEDCKEGFHSIRHKSFLNSGAILSISLMHDVGGFDETVPLYFSDFNFFNRVRKCENYYCQLNIDLQHSMSSNDESDLEQFKKRFELYCDGALNCYKSISGICLMLVNMVLRAIKIGMRHRSFLFVRIVLRKIHRKVFHMI